MRVGKQTADKVIVRIMVSKIATEGKRKGKTVYETFESFDVFEADAAKVYKVAYDAIASTK